ncbi:MAG: FtsB family cell division protein [Desulfatiglandales bacterium]
MKLSVLILLFLGLLAAWLGFGERGLVHLYRMEQERQDHRERINRLEDENRKLLEEINRMRDDREYIESVARRELGLIKDDELLFRFAKDREKHPSTYAGEEHSE